MSYLPVVGHGQMGWPTSERALKHAVVVAYIYFVHDDVVAYIYSVFIILCVKNRNENESVSCAHSAPKV